MGNQTWWDVHVSRQFKVKLLGVCIRVELFAGGTHDTRGASDWFTEEKCSYSFQTLTSAFMSSSVLPPPHGTSSHGWAALIFLPPIFVVILSVFIVHRTVQCSKIM